MTDLSSLSLGAFLRDRRTKLDPAQFGVPLGHRRTPGLRREELAQRANISPAWYTSLEQGRGGAPSEDVLDRLSRALSLTESEREHLYLLGLGRMPKVRYRRAESVPTRLQRILDRLDPCPALIRTATWDILAWNGSFDRLFEGLGDVPARERNALRLLLLHPMMRQGNGDNWRALAGTVISAFKVETARAGATAEADVLASELIQLSPELSDLWDDSELAPSSGSFKTIRHEHLGDLVFETTKLAVDGRPDLAIVVFEPVAGAEALIPAAVA